MFEIAEEIEERHNSTDSECAVSVIQVSSIIDLSTGLKNKDDEFLGYPVIGYQFSPIRITCRLLDPVSIALRTDCKTVCPWDPRIKGLFFFQNGISISVSKIGQFLSDVRKIRDMISSKNPSSFLGC